MITEKSSHKRINNLSTHDMFISGNIPLLSMILKQKHISSTKHHSSLFSVATVNTLLRNETVQRTNKSVYTFSKCYE